MKTFLREHGHRVVFGVSAVALTLYLVLALLANEGDARDLDKVTGDIQHHLERPHGQFRAPERRPWLAQARGPWDSVVQARGVASGYAASVLTRVIVSDPEGPIVEPTQPVSVLPAIVAGGMAVSPYAVHLTWEVRPAPKEAGLLHPEIRGFRIEREIYGSGPWTAVGTVGAKETAFQDGKVEANASYAYRLVALTSAGELPVEVGLHVTVPDRWRIEYRYGGDGNAWVTIHKTDREFGAVSEQHLHRSGERIGWWPEIGDKKAVSKHVVNVNRRACLVDFDTGLTLESIRQVRVPVEVTRCRRTVGPKNLIACTRIVESRQVTVAEIVVRGPEGVRTVNEPPLKPRDERCAGCR